MSTARFFCASTQFFLQDWRLKAIVASQNTQRLLWEAFFLKKIAFIPHLFDQTAGTRGQLSVVQKQHRTTFRNVRYVPAISSKLKMIGCGLLKKDFKSSCIFICLHSLDITQEMPTLSTLCCCCPKFFSRTLFYSFANIPYNLLTKERYERGT